MRRLVGAASLIAVILAVTLALRSRRLRLPATSPNIHSACPNTPTDSPPLAPELSAAPLLVVMGAEVELRIDGQPPASAIQAGRHTLEAKARGAQPTNLEFQVTPFKPVLLDAQVSAGAVTVLLVGAQCSHCPNAVGDIDLRYRAGVAGDLGGVAQALTTGDWLKASTLMRAISPTARQAAEAARLLAILYAFAGRPSLMRGQLEQLPPETPLKRGLMNRDALERVMPSRQVETATARWNAITERFQRLTDRFVDEAPKPLTQLSLAFDALSVRFAIAHKKNDALDCEATLDAASTALTQAVDAMRAFRPGDCEWQRRLTESL